MEAMTDRFAYGFVPRLAVPLAVLALVCLLWLTTHRPTFIVEPLDSAPKEPEVRDTASNESPDAPRLFPAEDHASWLPPLAEDLSPVLAVGYPALNSPEAPQARNETTGPFLVAPSGPCAAPATADANSRNAAPPETTNDRGDAADALPTGDSTIPGTPQESAEQDDNDGLAGMSSVWPREDSNQQSTSGPAIDNRRSPSADNQVGTSPPHQKPRREPTGRSSALGAPEATAPSNNRQEEASTDETSAIEKPPGLLMLSLAEDRPRSEHLERIAQEADAHTRRGFELAGRGALFSARAEFITALRLVAQGLDAEYRTSLHSEALVGGLAALKEAGDFVLSGSALETQLDKEGIIGGHRTPVLKNADLEAMTTLEILQCYFTYAQEQLGLAVGPEMAGSMALRALGRLHTQLADERVNPVRAARPKAMTYYQAALLANPANYMASNDLGVLLATSGRYADARSVLEHSLAAGRQAQTLRNLIAVYQQLGDGRLAQRARYLLQTQFESAPRPANPRHGQSQVAWVPPQAFSRSLSPAGQSPVPKNTASPVVTTDPAGAAPPRRDSSTPPAPRQVSRQHPWDLLKQRK